MSIEETLRDPLGRKLVLCELLHIPVTRYDERSELKEDVCHSCPFWREEGECIYKKDRGNVQDKADVK